MMKVDLTNCDVEPIHIPGRIQHHGYLVAFDSNTYRVTHTSDNIRELLGVEPSKLIGEDVEKIVSGLGSARKGDIKYLPILEYVAQNEFENINPVSLQHNDTNYDIIVHRSGEIVVLEFEPSKQNGGNDLQRMIGISMSRILEARTFKQTLEYAAKQIREIIGYDRVMIYKFWADGHGEVIAEDKEESLEPFFGLHYPASDIPKQARELYKINLVRLIADVHSTSRAILSHPSLKDQPLDLTHSTLRAVSPIHIEYLKNMGVMASFSVSIVMDNKLWGLIACHNYTPKFIDYRSRNSAKLIGQILSSSLELRLEEEQKEQSRTFQANLHTLIRGMLKDWDIAGGLVHRSVNILHLTEATGAALMYENKLYLLGITPTEEETRAIETWCHQNLRQSIYHTDSLSKEFAPAIAYKDKASGILFCSLTRELHECIIWFRPELIRTVNWAGNPQKPVEMDSSGEAKLSPRRSFAAWSEEVAATSAPWSDAEIGSVMKLREEIIQIINQKANQIRSLNEKLQKAYDELDTFSFTISHDLKTPLASIRNYAEIVQEDHTELPDDVKNVLTKIIKASDRMNLLIKEVLSYSRIGRQELKPVELDMARIIEQAKSENLVALNLPHAEFIVGDTPPVAGDHIMISQVFNNLIGNALKYSSKLARPRVRVSGEVAGDEVIYSVEDNGIGIDMQYGNQVFELFKRLESARHFEGTGVGLAIVKRIIEKHKGKIWYESEKGLGTKFYLSFNKQPS